MKIITYTLKDSEEGPVKSFREYLWFQTKAQREYLNITPQVETGAHTRL